MQGSFFNLLAVVFKFFPHSQHSQQEDISILSFLCLLSLELSFVNLLLFELYGKC